MNTSKSTQNLPTEEHLRLANSDANKEPWKKWGPYLSERQWGTVREDLSSGVNAWDSFTHDMARSMAYQYGEDGIAGISDDQQQLCFALTCWNGQDPILKERLFGLTNSEGNHGEDVKEYYYYLDNTPTHSYMKYLYKYPQKAYPYDHIVSENGKRTRLQKEYELIDTGIFNDNRYFDIFIEYAKESVDDILIKISIHNRANVNAQIHLLPTLWFRNSWMKNDEMTSKPSLEYSKEGLIISKHPKLGQYHLYFKEESDLLFCDNETNQVRFGGKKNVSKYVKDAFHNYLIKGDKNAINPQKTGTKSAVLFKLDIPPLKSKSVTLRLSKDSINEPFAAFDDIFSKRFNEANNFCNHITPTSLTDDEKLVFRQAQAGMLWGKQYYQYDLDKWLLEQGSHPFSPTQKKVEGRNSDWYHMNCSNIISMPDKWEYPWFAAWDLAFHTLSLGLVDMAFAKEQLLMLLNTSFQHPNGQIPAYEWNFGDVNPPVHAWATLYLYKMELAKGINDIEFIEKSFYGLTQNFNWWINRKDPSGKSVFAGGFLGLDNIGVFDRSAELPTGGSLEQADGTAWMAFYCQNMIELSLILSEKNEVYQEYAFRYVQHFIRITYAMDRIGDNDDEMWDEKDGFFYDLLCMPDGEALRLKTRSLVGLLPLCASSIFEANHFTKNPRFAELLIQFRDRHPKLFAHIAPLESGFVGKDGRRLLSVLNKSKLEKVLKYMLDEQEFLSPYGIRSLSKYHQNNPYSFVVGTRHYKVEYLPAESDSGMFGGNSNWRGPIWMPANVLLIRSLMNLHRFYGDDFKVECPTGSGVYMTLLDVAQEITKRLTSIFLKDKEGRRPVFGDAPLFQTDPLWNNHILFYEYFDGDTGEGLGASHQTGWTGNISALQDFFGRIKDRAY